MSYVALYLQCKASELILLLSVVVGVYIPLFKLLPWLWEKETTPRPRLDEATLEYKATMSPGMPARSVSKADLLSVTDAKLGLKT